MQHAAWFVLVLALAGAAPANSPAAPARCAVTIFPRDGTYRPTPRLHGPALLLDGGGALDAPNATLAWMHDRLTATPQRAGNVLVLRASENNLYDALFYRYGRFASVQTVLIPPCASAAQVDAVAPLVDRADAVYWAGGDQAHYAAWKGSALIAAVKRVYARGGIVGGGSAGLAIQGGIVYDSIAADRLGVDTNTRDAVRDPLERRISFTTGFFAWPALANTLTDTHFVVRDRFGRSVAFLARIARDRIVPQGSTAYVLAIDEASAVAVDAGGRATLFNGPGGAGAYLIRLASPAALVPGAPLRATVAVWHAARNGERFDLLRKSALGPWYAVRVDGAKTPPYDRDPYRP